MRSAGSSHAPSRPFGPGGSGTCFGIEELGHQTKVPSGAIDAARVVVPEVEHCLAEVLNDVAAIEINVFHQCPAIVAVEDDMFMLARRAATLNHHAKRVRRADWSMRDIRRDEERFALAHKVINGPIALADAHFNVALELVKILFRIDEMKIVPRVRTLDDHDEKIAPVIQITVAHRRFELFPVLFDPVLQINRRLHGGRDIARRRLSWRVSKFSHAAGYFLLCVASNQSRSLLPTGNGQDNDGERHLS